VLRRWMLPVLLVTIGLVVAVTQDWPWAVAWLVPYVLAAGLLSPLVFPRSLTQAEAERRSAADGRPIVYWRPGCKFCLRLRLKLGRNARLVHWVDIWRDPEGATVVRGIANGNETVPTVVVAGEGWVNPDPAWLRARLR
jgi:mycoredoxin